MTSAICVMGAPVVIEVFADPPRDDLVGALLGSCSAAVGGAGCTLDTPGRSGPARARAVVRFSGGLARVRVEVDAPGASPEVREVDFRPEDPAIERFHAAGLVAAGLVDDGEQGPTAAPSAAPSSPAPPPAAGPLDASSPPSPPPAESPPSPLAASPPPPQPPAAHPVETDPRSGDAPVHVSAAALLGWTQVRPWWGAVLEGDVALGRSRFFAGGSILYARTWSPSAAGISEERASQGAGGGVATALGLVRLRVRAGLELNELRVSVVQAGRSGDGWRVLVGAGAGVDLAVPVGGACAVVGGARGAWLGDSTAVTVGGKPAPSVPAWTYGVTLGLEARIR
jgi:hypothetical protein